jgi:hypothetical protein
MLKRICLIVFLMAACAAVFSGNPKRSMAQDDMAAYKDNSCVSCHSNDSKARASFNRYSEWYISTHKEKGVGCDKCHGGDPAAKDEKKAHSGMLKPSDARSRLNPKNLPATCNSCHPGVVSSFVESKHYQKLTAAGMGPTCTTCHTHMATTVLHTPEETGALCAHCHDADNNLMPRRPEIPEKAASIMQALRRANTVVLWADRLLTEGKNKSMELSDEEKEMKNVRATMADTKISWHTFNLETAQGKADTTFETGTKLKDKLRSKLHPEQSP